MELNFTLHSNVPQNLAQHTAYLKNVSSFTVRNCSDVDPMEIATYLCEVGLRALIISPHNTWHNGLDHAFEAWTTASKILKALNKQRADYEAQLCVLREEIEVLRGSGSVEKEGERG